MTGSGGRPFAPSPEAPVAILSEDPHFIVVFKPAGWIVQGARPGDRSLLEEVRGWIERRDRKPGRAFLGVVHRLDRPVCGVVVLAKRSKAASRLSARIREHAFEKVYRAVVENAPPERSGRLVHWLGWDDDARRAIVHDVERPGLTRAELEYRAIESRGSRYVLEIRPVTGRKHQIRAQLSSLGCPIAGDRRYGSGSDLGEAIGLVASALSFPHPTRADERVHVEVPEHLDPVPGWLGAG